VIGARPAGSEASRKTAAYLKPLLPNGRYEPVPKGLRNVVGSLPGKGKTIVVGAHYDSVPEPAGNLGANDSATGAAAVVELSRAMRKIKRAKDAPPIEFVLFDGEEAPAGCEPFSECGLRGSKSYVTKHRGRVGQMILLDYIAGKGTRLPREGTSDIDLWAKLRAAAKQVGATATFPEGIGPSISDDHTPFLDAGIPAIDLIDWSYRKHAHTPTDTMAQVSEKSLDAVGETVAQLLVTLSR
jgi:glutaminyl-peptide cyclotransferase